MTACHSNETQQAAVNPPLNGNTPKEVAGGGAPSAISYDKKVNMRIKSRDAFEEIFYLRDLKYMGINCRGLADLICENIWQGKIPHVRFCYENN